MTDETAQVTSKRLCEHGYEAKYLCLACCNAEIKRLTAIAEERDELVLEVARLQHALAFWLPHVPAREGEIPDRIAKDTFLLVGCDCGLETDAEERGWIKLVQSDETTPCTHDWEQDAIIGGQFCRKCGAGKELIG